MKYFVFSLHYIDSLAKIKNYDDSKENQKRIVTAPQTSLLLDLTTNNVPFAVISVELNKNEEVEWIWTILTGYNRRCIKRYAKALKDYFTKGEAGDAAFGEVKFYGIGANPAFTAQLQDFVGY